MRRYSPRLLLPAFGLLLLCSLPVVSFADPPSALPVVTEKGSDDLVKWWHGLPEDERRLMQRHNRTFENLPQEKQQKIRQRWERYQKMSPEQKQHLRQRYERWQSLSPQEREQLRRTFRQFKLLPEDQRQRIREEFRQLDQLPAEERDRRRKQLRERYFPGAPDWSGPGNGRGKNRQGGDKGGSHSVGPHR